MASRHLSRISTLQALFTSDMRGDLSMDAVLKAHEQNIASLPHDDEDLSFSDNILRGVIVKREEIDTIIEKAAPQWPIEKIAAVDRNILRVGLYELLFGDTTSVPPKVALNEAIEIAKIFGGDSSSRFVNGVLGAVYREMGSPRREEAPKQERNLSVREYLAGVVVCARFENDVRVALVRDPFGRWTLPKTKYEKGELSDGAALRAAREELGITDVVLKAPLGEHEYTAHDPSKGAEVRRVGYYAACAAHQPLSVGQGESVLEAEWFSEEELAELPLYDDLRDIITSGIVVARDGCI